MKFTDQLARRAVIILMLLTLANLWSSYKTSEAVHRLETTVNAQVQATTVAARQTVGAAQQAAAAVQSTANSAQQAAGSINRAALSLCSASHVDCKDNPPPMRQLSSPIRADSAKPL